MAALINDGQVMVWSSAEQDFVPTDLPTGSGGSSINPMVGLGDMIYGNADGDFTRLAGHTSAVRKFLRQIGTGSGSAAPAWDALAVGDIPDLSSVYQPLNAKLTAIAALANANGFLRNNGSGVFSYDTSTYATQAYVDSAVVGLLDDRGNYNASGNVFPSSGGSGSAGAILKGDLWTISVAGTLGGHPVTAGDVVRALVDTPGQTDANWAIGENNFGYVALNQALADGKIYVGNASGIGTAVTPSGDVTISNSGVTAIGASKVTNAMLAGSIAFSKLLGTDRTLTAGAGLTGGGDLSADRTFTVGAGAGITVNADDVALTTPGTLTVSTSNSSTGNHTHAITSSSNPGAALSILASDANGYLRLVRLGLGMAPSNTLDVTGTLGLTGNATFGANANPATNYTSNLGSLTTKYLTVHAAELWVQTIVAQNTVATIGGRVIVAPTTPLSGDVGTSDTSITVKYNNLNAGDRIYLEADGKVEFMAVNSSAGGSAGAYVYTVTRNLDGSGANLWYAGDAVVNTGTTGNGHIDIYSVSGVIPGSTNGPTIVGNVRTGTTYNNIEARWAIGNLKGLYGYGSDTYGAAFGVPGDINITVDATNGYRARVGTTLRQTLDATNGLRFFKSDGSTVALQLNMSGGATFAGDITATGGAIGGFNIGSDYIRDAANSFGLASTVTGGDDVRFWAGDTFANRATAPFRVTEAGAATMTNVTASGAFTLNSGSITGVLNMSGAGGAIAIGSTPPTSAIAGTGLWLDRNGLTALSVDQVAGGIGNGGLFVREGSTAPGSLAFHDSTGSFTSKISINKSNDGTGETAAAVPYVLLNTNSGASHGNIELTGSGTKVFDGLLITASQVSAHGSYSAPNAMLDVRGSGIVTGGLNVGSATGAATGNVKISGVYIAGSTPTTLTDSAGKILSAALNTVAVAQGGTGVTTSTGSTNNVLSDAPTLKGKVTITAPTSGRALDVDAVASDWAMQVTGANFGARIAAGTNSASDFPFAVYRAGFAALLFTVAGNGGVVVGAPTGDNKGAGTINAQAVYDDGVLLTDWMFDLHFDGKAKKLPTKPQKPIRTASHSDEEWTDIEKEFKQVEDQYKIATARLAPSKPHHRLFSISETYTSVSESRRLPWMPSQSEFETERHTGGMLSRLWQGQEQQQLYIFQLEDRIKLLEAQLARKN